MYEKFFRLNQNPFQINTDPKFLWLGKKHKEALATLQYGVLDNKSFLLLTGDIGTGKTTLINALLKLHSQDTLIATIKDPRLPPLELFNYIAYSYGIKKHFTSKSEFLIAFEQFLQKKYYQSKKVLLIIDESQRFQQETLEEIRCLSNIEIGGNKLIHIYFIGQNEFNAILAREENKAISQRITVSYNIQPLTEDEVAQYIEHRLTVAGGHKTIFDKNALKEIASCSKGYPRLINILCDRCLLTGFVQGQKTISRKIVAECYAELDITAHIPAEKTKTGSTPHTPQQITPPSYPFTFWHLATILGFALGIAIFVAVTLNNGRPTMSPYIQTVPTRSVIQPVVASTPPPTPLPKKVAAKHPQPIISKVIAPVPQKIQVHFQPNSITPGPEDIELLKNFADSFMQMENARILITGHTDADGSAHYNKRLAEFRANTIKTFLAARGINMQKVTSTGAPPPADTVSQTATQTNQSLRRVDLEIVFQPNSLYSEKRIQATETPDQRSISALTQSD